MPYRDDYHKRKQVKNTPTDNVSVADIIANLEEDSESDDDEAPDHDKENCEVLFYVSDEDTDTDSEEEEEEEEDVEEVLD